VNYIERPNNQSIWGEHYSLLMKERGVKALVKLLMMRRIPNMMVKEAAMTAVAATVSVARR
jgi:hypothetical protein